MQAPDTRTPPVANEWELGNDDLAEMSLMDGWLAALDRIAVALHNAAQHTPFTTTEWEALEQAQVDARNLREAILP